MKTSIRSLLTTSLCATDSPKPDLRDELVEHLGQMQKLMIMFIDCDHTKKPESWHNTFFIAQEVTDLSETEWRCILHSQESRLKPDGVRRVFKSAFSHVQQQLRLQPSSTFVPSQTDLYTAAATAFNLQGVHTAIEQTDTSGDILGSSNSRLI